MLFDIKENIKQKVNELIGKIATLVYRRYSIDTNYDENILYSYLGTRWYFSKYW